MGIEPNGIDQFVVELRNFARSQESEASLKGIDEV
jgi:hypothetical protein